MKKAVALLLTATLATGLLFGCGGNKQEAQQQEQAKLEVITVGASTTPHAEILAAAKDVLAADGYELKVVEFTDYVQPNLTLENGELDANYFQHQPYLDNFNAENKTNLVSAASIHYEPFGIYAGKSSDLANIPEGATIAVPNDTSNEARALLLLEAQGIISINPEAGINATVQDITANPHNIKIMEIEAAVLARTLSDADFAVINGNYALAAGLNAATDALAIEDKDSVGASTYANIVAVRAGEENSEKTQALIKALTSDTVKKFIEETYSGGVVPTF